MINIISVFLLIVYIPRFDKFKDSNSDVFKTWIDLYQIANTLSQKILYVVWCFILFAGVYLIRFLRSDKKIDASASNKYIFVFIIINVVIIIISYFRNLLDIKVNEFVISILTGIVLIFLIQGIMFQKLFKYLMVPVFFLFIYFFYIGPFHKQLYLDSIPAASFIDFHIAATVTPGFLMGNEVSVSMSNYGIGMNLLIFLSKMITDYFGFNLTQIGLISFFQIAGTLLGLILIKLFETRSFFFFGSLFMVTNLALTNLTINLVTPNQSLLRYFIFLLQIVLYFIILKTNDSVYLIAALSAVGLILSPSLGAIFLFAALANRLNFTNFRNSLIELIKMILVTLIIYLLSLYLIINFVSIQDNSVSVWFSFIKGFGGYASIPSINFYLLLIAFSNMIIVLSLYKTNLITYKLKFIIFLSSISLIWMVYYVNRMFDQNLWFLILLLTFIFILLLDEILSNKISIILIPPLISMLVLFSYQITLSSKQLVFPYASQRCDGKSIFPDFCFNQELTVKTTKEFDYLLKNIDPDQSIILTGFPGEFRVLGYNRNFYNYALLAEASTNSQVLEFSSRLDNSVLNKIVLHNNQEFYFYPPMLEDYNRILKSLKNYKLSYSIDSFDIYEKIN
jgi:hypothetical protein